MKNKKVIIAGVALLAFILAAILILPKLFSKKEESYRIIKIYEIAGKATVKRDKIGEIDAYENMVLKSGDYIRLVEGKITLKLDDDKYVYAQDQAEFELIALGNAANSKTSIKLISGGLLNDIQNKLSDDSYYEINTPNATASVRGTVFDIAVTRDADGKCYTKVMVYQGEVEAAILDGENKTGESRTITVGKEATICMDGEERYFVGEVAPIEYDEIPEETLAVITNVNKIRKTNEKVEVEIPTGEEGNPIIENPSEGEEEETCEITYLYDGKVFATQKAKKGELLKKPTLVPAQSGSWDYDFTTAVSGDTTINWK